jgi:hypothetical protein
MAVTVFLVAVVVITLKLLELLAAVMAVQV